MIYQSTCARCMRPGVASTDQSSHAAHKRGGEIAGMRFWCVCGHIWIADFEALERHTRWMQRVGLS